MRYSSEVGERAVRLVLGHECEFASQRAAIRADCREDRWFERDAAELGKAGRACCGQAAGAYP